MVRLHPFHRAEEPIRSAIFVRVRKAARDEPVVALLGRHAKEEGFSLISAAVLDALVAAGASTEMIVAAVKADAREEENKAAEKRAKDAARQRKSRMSRGLSVTSCDSDGHSVTVLSPKEKPPAPPKEITPISCSDDQR